MSSSLKIQKFVPIDIYLANPFDKVSGQNDEGMPPISAFRDKIGRIDDSIIKSQVREELQKKREIEQAKQRQLMDLAGASNNGSPEKLIQKDIELQDIQLQTEQVKQNVTNAHLEILKTRKIDVIPYPRIEATSNLETDEKPKLFNETDYKKRTQPISREHGLIYSYCCPNLDSANQPLQIETKILICVTMYNEALETLQNTLFKIKRNLKGLQQRGVDPREVVVVVLQDGLMKMNNCLPLFDQLDQKYAKTYEQYQKQVQDAYRGKKEELKDISLQLMSKEIMKDQMTARKRQEILKQERAYCKKKINDDDEIPASVPKKIALLYQDELTNHDLGFDKASQGEADYNLTTFFLLKHLNGQKLSSHMWFFNGFCKLFQPKYVALIDVGTLPYKDGLVNFYVGMESDQQIGGASGYMGLYNNDDMRQQMNHKRSQVEQSKGNEEEIQKQEKIKKSQQFVENANKLIQKGINQDEYHKESMFQDAIQQRRSKMQSLLGALFILPLVFLYLGLQYIIMTLFYLIFFFLGQLLKLIHHFFDVKKAQLFQYTYAHLLDKNFESFFGFLQVLPGAWSFYRYEAISENTSGRRDLLQRQYLVGALDVTRSYQDHKEANMFLAEDRILCLGIFTQVDKNYTLKYFQSAHARTDAVDKFQEFLNQRRRWINSSWFASEYVIHNYDEDVRQTNHSIFRYLAIFICMQYAQLGNLNTYLIPAFYYLTIHISSYYAIEPQIRGSEQAIVGLAGLLPLIYIFVVLNLLLLCLLFKIKSVDPFNFYNGQDQNQDRIARLRQLFPLWNENDQHDNIFKDFTESFNYVKIENLNPEYLLELKHQEKIDKLSKILKAHQQNPQDDQIKQHLEKARNDIQQLQKHVKNDYKKKADDRKTHIFETIFMGYYHVVCGFLGVLHLVTLGVAVWSGVQMYFLSYDETMNSDSRFVTTALLALVIGNFGSYIILFLFNPLYWWDILKSVPSYLYYQSIYMHVLVFYSFCNIDDVTWGTKGLDGSTTEEFKVQKLQFIAKWISTNAIVIFLALILNNYFSDQGYVLLGMGVYGSLILMSKSTFAIIHLVWYYARKMWDYLEFCLCKRNQLLEENEIINEKINQKQAEIFDQTWRNDLYPYTSKLAQEYRIKYLEKAIETLNNPGDMEFDPKQDKNFSQFLDNYDHLIFKCQHLQHIIFEHAKLKQLKDRAIILLTDEKLDIELRAMQLQLQRIKKKQQQVDDQDRDDLKETKLIVQKIAEEENLEKDLKQGVKVLLERQSKNEQNLKRFSVRSRNLGALSKKVLREFQNEIFESDEENDHQDEDFQYATHHLNFDENEVKEIIRDEVVNKRQASIDQEKFQEVSVDTKFKPLNSSLKSSSMKQKEFVPLNKTFQPPKNVFQFDFQAEMNDDEENQFVSRAGARSQNFFQIPMSQIKENLARQSENSDILRQQNNNRINLKTLSYNNQLGSNPIEKLQTLESSSD